MNKNILHIVKQQNIKKDKPIIVALSGGVDSMVLFDVMQKLNYDIVVAHVNHNKRIESKKEYKQIQELCELLHIPFEGLVLPKDITGNFQEQARQKRYDFFTKVAKEYKASSIALAHHADDQIETILMRLSRGSSFQGYSGIKQRSEYHSFSIIRPLLTIEKEDILNYAKENNLTFFEDLSNKSDAYTRNRYRNNIIPLLRNENPQLHEKIMQFAKYIELADTILDKEKKAFLDKHQFNGKIDINAFIKLEEIIKIKIIQHLVNEKSKNGVEVTYGQYQDIINLISNDNPNIVYNLSKGFELVKEYTYFFVRKQESFKRVFLEINEFGEYSISKEIMFVISDKKLDLRHSNSYEVWYNESVFPLYIRNKQNGDKMRLKIGTKKVKDILIDQKVPVTKRENLILVANSDTVLWIPRIKKAYQNTEQPNKIYIYEVR